MTKAKAVASSLVAAAFSFVLAAPACTDSSGNGAGAAGGSNGAGGAGCSSIENVGETVTQVQAEGTAPAPMGGTVADGSYVFTKSEAYPPLTANVPAHLRQTLQISGTALNIAVVSDEFPSGFTAAGTFTTSGTQFTITYQCGPGAGSSFSQGYTATPTELIFISDPGSVSTFTKQ